MEMRDVSIWYDQAILDSLNEGRTKTGSKNNTYVRLMNTVGDEEITRLLYLFDHAANLRTRTIAIATPNVIPLVEKAAFEAQ